MPGEEKVKYGLIYRFFLSFIKFIVIALAVILVVVFVYYSMRNAYNLGYESTTYEPVATEKTAEDIEVTVTLGMTTSELGQMLIDAGLIDETLSAFLIQDRLSGLHDEYIPGTYTLSNAMTVDEILQIICTPPEEDS